MLSQVEPNASQSGCRFSFCPYGRTGQFTVFCKTCMQIREVVANPGEAKILAGEMNESGEACRREPGQLDWLS